MSERGKPQLDFFEKLEKPGDVVEIGASIESEPKPDPALVLDKKNTKKVRQGSNIPAGGRLGGWQSHYDGNANDKSSDKKWKA